MFKILVSLNSCNATSDAGKAQLFNTFFHSVFTDSSFSLPNLGTLPIPPSCVCALILSYMEVFDALSSLDPTKASGCDDIGPELIIKHCASALHILLHQLFSLSLSKQSISNEWKYHSIIPIFKSGDKSQVKNYGPISLLCIVSKVLEHLIYRKVSKFITDNNILRHHQFGFRQHHSTTQQLLIFLSNMLLTTTVPNVTLSI